MATFANGKRCSPGATRSGDNPRLDTETKCHVAANIRAQVIICLVDVSCVRAPACYKAGGSPSAWIFQGSSNMASFPASHPQPCSGAGAVSAGWLWRALKCGLSRLVLRRTVSSCRKQPRLSAKPAKQPDKPRIPTGIY